MTRLNENIPMTRLNENSPLTRPTEFSENEKGRVLDNLDPEPSLSDLLPNESDSSNDRKYRKSKSKRRNKKKITGNAQNRTRQTHCRVTLIRLTKIIIKARDAIRRRDIGKVIL